MQRSDPTRRHCDWLLPTGLWLALALVGPAPAAGQADVEARTIPFPVDVVEELQARGEAFLPGTGMSVRLAEGVTAVEGEAATADEQLLIVDGVITGLSTDENAAELMYSADVELIQPLGVEHAGAIRFGRPILLISTRNAPNRPASVADDPESPMIILRGGDSGPTPLLVVDGLIVNPRNCPAGQTNCLSTATGLRPEDIESIQVVKGAAAAALYGPRAAGGVVTIRTKKR